MRRRGGFALIETPTDDGGSTEPTSSPTAVDLPAELARARQAETPLAQRVHELDAALAEALEISDFKAADLAKTALPDARARLAVAHAQVVALEQATLLIAQQRATDEATINRRAKLDQAHRDLAAAHHAQSQAQGDVESHRAAISAGMDAIKASYQAALTADDRVEAARQAAYQAQVTIAEDQPMPPPPQRRGQVRGWPERDRVLWGILNGRSW